MIEQYLSNANESARVSISQKISKLNKAQGIIWWTIMQQNIDWANEQCKQGKRKRTCLQHVLKELVYKFYFATSWQTIKSVEF